MIKEIFFGSLGIIIVILVGYLVFSPVVDCFDYCYEQADGNKTIYNECTYGCHQKMFPEDNTTLEEWMVMNHG